MPTDSDILAEVPFFSLLDDAERNVLGGAAGRRQAERRPAGLPLRRSRRFAVRDPRRRRRGVLQERHGRAHRPRDRDGPGDFFGEISLLDGGPRTASAVVTEDLEALVLDREGLDEFLRVRPAASIDLLAATGRRLRQTAQLLRNTASRNVNKEIEDHRTKVQRVADWISDFSGSLPFLFLHLGVFGLWIGVNVIPGLAFDSYPVRAPDDGRVARGNHPLGVRAPEPEPAGRARPGANGTSSTRSI